MTMTLEEAIAAYEATRPDRGGKSGPKGIAYAKWLGAHGEMVIAALKGTSHE